MARSVNTHPLEGHKHHEHVMMWCVLWAYLHIYNLVYLHTPWTEAVHIHLTTSRSAHAAFAIALGALGMLDELEHHDSACYTQLLHTHHPLVIGVVPSMDHNRVNITHTQTF